MLADRPWVDPDTHGWVVPTANPDAWSELLDDYGGVRPAPLRRVFELVRESGCQTAVVENRYVDQDFRSDYSAFWSHRFDAPPPFSRRIHFFRSSLTDDDLHDLDRHAEDYLGYAVVRPTPLGSLCRTMIAPPPRLETACLVMVEDRVRLFGAELSVRASPFMQQDTEFLVCAHVSAWMCHYTAVRRGLVARALTAEIVEATPDLLNEDRPFPSRGMTLNQLQAVFGSFGQPALFYGLDSLPTVQGVEEEPNPPKDADGYLLPAGVWDIRVFSILCRYLNSGFPVLIGTSNHAFVVVGWFREGKWIRFVVNDDQQGPYRVLDSPFTDERGPWRSIMVPLPPKALLSGESAENSAHLTFRSAGVVSGPSEWKALADGLESKSVLLRTRLHDGSDYKRVLVTRGLDEQVTRLLRLARLPHYIWVVEAQDRALRDAGEPSVLGEIVYDATSADDDPYYGALMLPGWAATYPPGRASPVSVTTSATPWASNLPRI